MSIVCASICLCINTHTHTHDTHTHTHTHNHTHRPIRYEIMVGGGDNGTHAQAHRGKGVGHLPEYDLEEFGHVVGIEQRYIAHQLPLVLVRHTRRSPPAATAPTRHVRCVSIQRFARDINDETVRVGRVCVKSAGCVLG
jgi:hypothetical protein